MKKVMCLIILVVFAGIVINAQERRRPELSREKQEMMKKKFHEMGKKDFPGMEKKKEFFEMAQKKRHLEFENYISKLESEKEMREIELEKARIATKGGKGSCGGKWDGGKCRTGRVIGHMIFCLMFMMVMAVAHILLTVWVFVDTRKRDASGLWIVITLLTGFMGAFLYALVRIGDKK